MYCSLIGLMEENLGETYKVNQETAVNYRDDEVHPINGKWVQLKPFDNVAVVEMIRCAGEVPGTDFKRIKLELQQSEISRPPKSPRAKQISQASAHRVVFTSITKALIPLMDLTCMLEERQVRANGLIIQPDTKQVQAKPEAKNFMMILLQVHLQLSSMWKVNRSN